MALKQRVADASYWVYGRARAKAAFEAAGRPGTATGFDAFRDEKYISLVTFRKDGTPVPTPLWFAILEDGRLVSRTEGRTAKVARIRRNPRVRVLPCDVRGKPLGPAVECTAQVFEAPEDEARAEAALDQKYGRTRRVYERVMTEEDWMVYLAVTPTPAA